MVIEMKLMLKAIRKGPEQPHAALPDDRRPAAADPQLAFAGR